MKLSSMTPNRLGRTCFCICCAVSCILFQLMFCGLICVFVGFAFWMVPDALFSMHPQEIISFCYERNEDAVDDVMWLSLFSVLSLMFHLALICFVALRRPRPKTEETAKPRAGQPEALPHGVSKAL